MKPKVKDVLIRAMKTFWQAVIAYLATSFGTQVAGIDVFNFDALKNCAIGLTVGAVAAGLSASWNGVIQPALDKLKKTKGGEDTVEGE